MSTVALSIRPETSADHSAVFELHRRAFDREGEARLVEALRRQPGHLPELSLVAERDGAIVGYVLLSPIVIHTDDGDRPALALGPVSADPAMQRQGVGSALIRAGLDACHALGQTRVIVLGHPDYYPRFGFVSASRWGIRAPFEVPDPAFMALELEPSALAGCAGVVEYPAPFADVE